MLHKHLVAKGWSNSEIKHLKKHFKPKKEPLIFSVVAAILLCIAIVVVPHLYAMLLRILPGVLFLVLLAVLGLVLGTMFGLLFISFHKALYQQHIVFVVLLLIVSVVASPWVFTSLKQNTLIPAVIYAVTFIVPYMMLVKSEWNSSSGLSST